MYPSFKMHLMTIIISLKYNNSSGIDLSSFEYLLFLYPSLNFINSPFLPYSLAIIFFNLVDNR